MKKSELRRGRSRRNYAASKKPVGSRACNLCGGAFTIYTRFQRFCYDCKSDKDVFRFAEWLNGSLPVAV